MSVLQKQLDKQITTIAVSFTSGFGFEIIGNRARAVELDRARKQVYLTAQIGDVALRFTAAPSIEFYSPLSSVLH